MTEIARINYKIVQPGDIARYQLVSPDLDIKVADYSTEWVDYMKIPRFYGDSYQSKNWLEVPQFELLTKSESQAWNFLDQMTKQGGHYLIVNRENRNSKMDIFRQGVFGEIFTYLVGIAWCKEPFLDPSVEIKDSYPVWCPIKL